jgi:glycerophosphoryl diester phosphodiesterase
VNTKIYAHRGASKYAPENTMPAFELAYNMKADGIETDIQLTKDGIPVLIHDEKVRRTTGGKGLVMDYTVKEIKKLDAGRWFSDEFKGTPIVTLEEFLQWIKPKPLLLNLELKNNIIDYKQLEQKVYDLVKAYGLLERTVFSSFNPKSMERMHNIDPTVQTAFLTSKRIRRLFHFVQTIGASSIHAKYRILDPHLIGECKKHGIDLRIYTVNRLNQMIKCFALDVTGIFTDVPDIARKQLELMQADKHTYRKFPFRRM